MIKIFVPDQVAAGTGSRLADTLANLLVMSEKIISQAIKQAEIDLRSKYSVLKQQDLVGFGIFIGSLLSIALCWTYYIQYGDTYTEYIIVVLLIAFFTSFLHELEHDLIHNLYFKRNIMMQDIMFMCIWLAKLHGNPWFRRELHLKHHIISGQRDDAEERLIGLGIPISLKRMAVTIHPYGSLIIMSTVSKDAKWLDVKRMNLTTMPIATIFFILNKLYILYILIMYIVGYNNFHNYISSNIWKFIYSSNILICLPNILRQSCLVLMSNCSHYYGDIPEKSVFYQNQILDHPIFYPFQLFCVNFGTYKSILYL